MELHYLDFDCSDNGDGGASWDAMACVQPVRLAAALREAEAILAWAHAEFGTPGEWAGWDFDLQCQQEGVGDLGVAFDQGAGAVQHQAPAPGGGRCTLTLTLSGSHAFDQALRERFSAA